MIEVWRNIDGFPGYSVSNLGRVRGPIAILKPYRSRYSQVTLYRHGEKHLRHVHRLVCQAFHGDQPSPDHEVAHGDGDPHNNAAKNLRWATRHENEADKVAHGTSLAGKKSRVPSDRQARGETHGRNTKPWRTARGEQAGRAKLTEKTVRAILADTRPRKIIAEEHGVTVAMIGLIQTRKAWQHVF